MLKKLLSVMLAVGLTGHYNMSHSSSGSTSILDSSEVATIGTVNGNPQALHCIAFSPYVNGYNPNGGPHPSPALIDQLLDIIVQQTDFRCIMTYGVLNGLDYTFEAAKSRGIQIIANIWLDNDPAVDDQSITLGIQKAQAYTDTIIRLSCGVEVRTRHGASVAEQVIDPCINRLKEAGVTQPITSIDTWYAWCDEHPTTADPTCQPWNLADRVDWIGINIYPWWENKFSGIYTCTPAAEAADFHLTRMDEVMNTYPGKEVILTEFGWPAGPDGYSETNDITGEQCGVASEANQKLVLEETMAKLRAEDRAYVLFEAFREPWKIVEGEVGPYWGVCEGSPPYTCRYQVNPPRVYLPIVNSQ
jgi:exo-beta-1,3-glucanase (GH17 family)